MCHYAKGAVMLMLCTAAAAAAVAGRYMSPIEAREYGIIDHIIGGDEVRTSSSNRSSSCSSKH
jgi:ATP-dependent protease ClpP protease subunit